MRVFTVSQTDRSEEGGGGGGWIGVWKSADPWYFLARSVDPTDVIFALIRIHITEVLLLRDLGVQKYSQQLRKFLDRSHRNRQSWKLVCSSTHFNFALLMK